MTFTEAMDHVAKAFEVLGAAVRSRRRVSRGPPITAACSRREKDAAVASFAGDAPALLSTESAGEGRNLQFCHVMINVDLPWNPMQIEQRLGRLHRVGQQHDVPLTNLVSRGTIEERALTNSGSTSYRSAGNPKVIRRKFSIRPSELSSRACPAAAPAAVRGVLMRASSLWVPESLHTPCDLLTFVKEAADAVVSLDLADLGRRAVGEWP